MNPRGLDPHVVRRVLYESLRVWSENSKLTFREVNDDRADILVFFEKGYHGDGYPFDGPGQILAHAFFPGSGRGGDAHFDEEESWLLNGDETDDGTSLFAVAAHEFGHSLGLSHSSVAGALMFPWYQGWEPNFQLPDDDRNGIQQLYGPKDDKLWAVNPPYQQPPYYPEEPRRPQPPPRTEPPYYPEEPRRPQPPPRTEPPYYPEEPRRPQPPPRTEPPRRYPHVPAPTEPPRRYPPVPAPTEPPRRYPAPTEPPRRYPQRPTSAPYPSDVPKTKKPHVKHEKPDTCDTSYDAISIIRREIFIFKGRYIWRIGDKGLYAGYPAETHRMWHDLPKNYTHIDAVYERGDKRIVFFIDKLYYLYNGNRLERGFPRPLSDLGLPESLSKIDGAMVWGHNGKTYLFSGTMYWKFDEEVGKVELDYPRDMSMWRGVPYSIDTVFQWKDGKTYFFKGKGFWKFNDLRMRVENENPMLSAPFWMGCPRELESPTLPNNDLPQKEMLDIQPPSSTSSTLSVYSITLLTALFLHCIISRNP